ncbi:helix-turn-helix transcriptional regulator [Entomobacter blattae]|uniref:DNA-binding protein n=1 Tax=Entomobacter blattae TaxID=2762277 RepID=A0A7H1NTK2_9PROT|nr:helix-turn-helix transcriptional regulator [Entomobacter blattae]QNT79112.1 hypothetical protein JGUZn3_18980 [Entomobacter blattae]
MITHTNIWKAIDLLAAEKGLSPSALAKMAGLNVTTFNPSKRVSADGRKRWPSTESLALILHATNTTLSNFSDLLDTVNLSSSHSPKKTKQSHSKKEKIDIFFSILPMSSLEKSSCFTSEGFPSGTAWKHEKKNPLLYLNPSSSYALIIDTKDYEPVFAYQSTLVISTVTVISKKSYIFYQIKKHPKPAFGYLLNKTDTHLEIQSINSIGSKTVPLTNLKWFHRIVGQSF